VDKTRPFVEAVLNFDNGSSSRRPEQPDRQQHADDDDGDAQRLVVDRLQHHGPAIAADRRRDRGDRDLQPMHIGRKGEDDDGRSVHRAGQHVLGRARLLHCDDLLPSTAPAAWRQRRPFTMTRLASADPGAANAGRGLGNRLYRINIEKGNSLLITTNFLITMYD
jgi:hypothetical protein